MLQSYEAIYDYGQMKWLGDHPSVEKAHVIVTVLSEKGIPSPRIKHEPSPRMAGKGRTLVTQVALSAVGATKRRPPPELAGCEILGDIMAPTTEEADWDALK